MHSSIRVFFVAAVVATGMAASFGRVNAAPPAQAPARSPSVSPAPSPVPSVLPAGGEPAITTPGAIGDYLRAFHDRLHARWNQEFVKTVAATLPGNHPLNDPSKQATVALAIRWDGTIAEATVKNSSGSPEFDRAVMDVTRKGAPFPLPVADVISDDSYAHVEWTFARDHRACSAGAAVARVDDPLEVSLPRLIRANRVAEALRRVGQSASGKEEAGLDRFARLYLTRTVPDPILDTAAAVALAQAGDQAQAPRLRSALMSRPTMDMAAGGLRKLGIDICDVVREPLEAGTAAAREIAIGASRSVAVAGGDIASCRSSLATIVADGKQPIGLRLQALDTLVTFLPAAARPVVLAAMDDKDSALRGAALLASVRKGAGRPELYRLAPLLHDKAVEVRGAASAGMVRAGGDMALEQLYLLGRETDPRPGTWVAAELAQMSTNASAQFLGKMVRKSNPAVQVAAARALAGRKDAPARTEWDAVKSDARVPNDVRAAGVAVDAHALPVAAAPTPKAAAESVRQLLKDNRVREATDWIVERLASLEPRDAIDVLQAWLVRGPATAGTPSLAIPPASAGPSAESAVGTSAAGAAPSATAANAP